MNAWEKLVLKWKSRNIARQAGWTIADTSWARLLRDFLEELLK